MFEVDHTTESTFCELDLELYMQNIHNILIFLSGNFHNDFST